MHVHTNTHTQSEQFQRHHANDWPFRSGATWCQICDEHDSDMHPCAGPTTFQADSWLVEGISHHPLHPQTSEGGRGRVANTYPGFLGKQSWLFRRKRNCLHDETCMNTSPSPLVLLVQPNSIQVWAGHRGVNAQQIASQNFVATAATSGSMGDPPPDQEGESLEVEAEWSGEKWGCSEQSGGRKGSRPRMELIS